MYNQHFGPAGDPLILVAQAASRVLNPSLSESVVARAYERDPTAAASEYGGLFRGDIENFVAIEVVNACIDRGIRERPPEPNINYVGFVDPSGGSADAFTLAIGHLDGEIAVIDCVRERQPPFNPDSVAAEFAAALRDYRIRRISGDKYAGQWPVAAFRKYGIDYVQSAAPKSDLYLAFLPLLNSRRVAPLDIAKIVNQATGLERRTSRSGKDLIDHAPAGHDDLINVIAGVATTMATPQPTITMIGHYGTGGPVQWTRVNDRVTSRHGIYRGNDGNVHIGLRHD